LKLNSAKKVLIVLTSLCAEGTPVLVLEMCRLWIKNGIQVSVTTLQSEPTDLALEYQQLGISIHCLELPEFGYRRYSQMLLEIYRLCRQFRPDALLSMPFGWHTFMAYGARLAGVPRVVAHVGNYPPYWTGKAFKKFCWEVQLGRPVTNKLICCSHYIRRGVIQHFALTETETMMIYNGCSVEKVAEQADLVRQAQSTSKGSFIIGMIARLEAHKDQPTLIRAARLLKDRGISFEVQLIGEGSRRPEYETLIHDLQVQDCVSLLGMRRDIPQLLGKMNVFVFSAKPDEGLGIALIEAMAAGVPIIATEVGACKEVLDNGALGLLVPPKSPQHMVEAICELINHSERAECSISRARKKAFDEFAVETMVRKYTDCLGLTA
jgi:glycosyltransferase involved in cell wall biosynthesis